MHEPPCFGAQRTSEKSSWRGRAFQSGAGYVRSQAVAMLTLTADTRRKAAVAEGVGAPRYPTASHLRDWAKALKALASIGRPKA